MTLSRARDRLRKRLQRGTILPSPTTDLLMMGPEKRKERLVELITTPIAPDKVRAEHIIASIKELNLMEHVYDERGGDVTINIQVNYPVGYEPRPVIEAQSVISLLPEGADADD